MDLPKAGLAIEFAEFYRGPSNSKMLIGDCWRPMSRRLKIFSMTRLGPHAPV